MAIKFLLGAGTFQDQSGLVPTYVGAQEAYIYTGNTYVASNRSSKLLQNYTDLIYP